MTDSETAQGDSGNESGTMKAPVYEVHVPGMGPLWFPSDENGYQLAFQNATGERIEEVGEDHPKADRINIVDFDGTAEVPIV